jgi:hypothetical protein
MEIRGGSWAMTRIPPHKNEYRLLPYVIKLGVFWSLHFKLPNKVIPWEEIGGNSFHQASFPIPS